MLFIIWPAILFPLIYRRQKWTFSFWGVRLPHVFFFFAVMFSSLCMDWSDDQRYPSVPFAPFLSICTFIGKDGVRQFYDIWTDWGSGRQWLVNIWKWPAVLRRAKWSSAWWRTSKALWHHICVYYLQRHRKKSKKKKLCEIWIWCEHRLRLALCWVSSEMPWLTPLWIRNFFTV